MSRSRGFVFTINNFDDERLVSVKAYLQDHTQYGIVGIERGESGTPHLQGYIYFRNAKSFSSVVNALGEPRAHVERARGTPKQNRTYCSKQGDFYEFGTCPEQGRRKDLESIRSDIDKGITEIEIAQSHFSQWVQYRRAFHAYRQLVHHKPRSWKTVVVWIMGPTGTGKSRICYELPGSRLAELLRYTMERYHGNTVDECKQIYTSVDPTFNWVDGYNGQDIVLVDDYRGECDLATLLRVCDRYPMQLPIKGGFVEWSPKLIIFTSNLLPRACYSGKDSESIRPLLRRIDFLFEKPSLSSDFIDISNTIRY